MANPPLLVKLHLAKCERYATLFDPQLLWLQETAFFQLWTLSP